MTREQYEALMGGRDEPTEQHALVVAIGQLAREQRPVRELVDDLAADEEDWEDPGEDLDLVRLAAASRPRRSLPVRYVGEASDGAALVVDLSAGLGGLPTLTLLAAPGAVEVTLEGTRLPVEAGAEVLVPWVEEAPEVLVVEIGGASVALYPT